jgi:hypothetical protein
MLASPPDPLQNTLELTQCSTTFCMPAPAPHPLQNTLELTQCSPPLLILCTTFACLPLLQILCRTPWSLLNAAPSSSFSARRLHACLSSTSSAEHPGVYSMQHDLCMPAPPPYFLHDTLDFTQCSRARARLPLFQILFTSPSTKHFKTQCSRATAGLPLFQILCTTPIHNTQCYTTFACLPLLQIFCNTPVNNTQPPRGRSTPASPPDPFHNPVNNIILTCDVAGPASSRSSATPPSTILNAAGPEGDCLSSSSSAQPRQFYSMLHDLCMPASAPQFLHDPVNNTRRSRARARLPLLQILCNTPSPFPNAAGPEETTNGS